MHQMAAPAAQPVPVKTVHSRRIRQRVDDAIARARLVQPGLNIDTERLIDDVNIQSREERRVAGARPVTPVRVDGVAHQWNQELDAKLDQRIGSGHYTLGLGDRPRIRTYKKRNAQVLKPVNINELTTCSGSSFTRSIGCSKCSNCCKPSGSGAISNPASSISCSQPRIARSIGCSKCSNR